MRSTTLFKRIVALSLFLGCLIAPAFGQDTTNAPPFSEQDLSDFVGMYGPRTVSMSGASLTYQQEGMPTSVMLKQLDTDVFEIVVPPGAMVQGGHQGGPLPLFHFSRNEKGEVDGLKFILPDGTQVGEASRNDQSKSDQSKEDQQN